MRHAAIGRETELESERIGLAADEAGTRVGQWLHERRLAETRAPKKAKAGGSAAVLNRSDVRAQAGALGFPDAVLRSTPLRPGALHSMRIAAAASEMSRSDG
ncbi:hypothetical protein LBMAG56_09050 [Verrucomicrobiota bacterium]|nr:hypothetical protein LBMAG56_09050 [Verrucomicrobiota bacterium]